MSFKLNTKLQARKKAVLTGRLKRRAEKCILEDKDEDSGGIDGSDNETVTNGANIDKVQLVHRYLNLLKTTLIAFFLSTVLHIGVIFGYYGTYLWLYPDDKGKKDFYSLTTVNKGVNIGGRNLGGGGVMTNHHKSYLLHLVREYYKGLSKTFFIEFSVIYVFFLFVLKFFPEREKLKEDTAAVFASYKLTNQIKDKPKKKTANKVVKKKRIKIKKIEEDEENEIVENSSDQCDMLEDDKKNC